MQWIRWQTCAVKIIELLDGGRLTAKKKTKTKLKKKYISKHYINTIFLLFLQLVSSTPSYTKIFLHPLSFLFCYYVHALITTQIQNKNRIIVYIFNLKTSPKSIRSWQTEQHRAVSCYCYLQNYFFTFFFHILISKELL